MYGLFKKRKKSSDIAEHMKLDKENDRGEQYQLSLSYYRTTSLAESKKSSRCCLEKVVEAVDDV